MKRGLGRPFLTGTLCLWLLITNGRLTPRSVWAADPPAIIQRDYEILEVYLQVEEALRLAFPQAERFVTEEVRLTDDQKHHVAALADHPIPEETFTVYKAMRDGRLDGYAVVTEEIGRFHDITFLVAVTPEGTVKRVEVLVYRESRGGEVRQRRFLHQFDGKSLRDPIRLNRDLLNITGATLSVRAMSRGVRKVLGVIHEVYLTQ